MASDDVGGLVCDTAQADVILDDKPTSGVGDFLMKRGRRWCKTSEMQDAEL